MHLIPKIFVEIRHVVHQDVHLEVGPKHGVLFVIKDNQLGLVSVHQNGQILLQLIPRSPRRVHIGIGKVSQKIVSSLGLHKLVFPIDLNL
jgi:hypothetical protein